MKVFRDTKNEGNDVIGVLTGSPDIAYAIFQSVSSMPTFVEIGDFYESLRLIRLFDYELSVYS